LKQNQDQKELQEFTTSTLKTEGSNEILKIKILQNQKMFKAK